MSYNPDPNKEATEVLFSRKVSSDDHPKLTFNGNQVQQCSSQKNSLHPSVSRQSLQTIYRSFVRPILDYADIIYEKPHKGSFIEKIERVQCNAWVVSTGAFKGTSRECLYQELGLESLKDRRWHRKLCFFLQNCERTFPKYLT